jgi:hypothetical protein
MTPEQLGRITSGAVIASAHVADARPLTSDDEARALIECVTSRYGLILADVRPVEPPIPARGSLGIWYLEKRR